MHASIVNNVIMSHSHISPDTSRRQEKFCTRISEVHFFPKGLEEIHSTDVQVEESDEGRLVILFGVIKETEADKRLSTRILLKNADQKKSGKAMEGLSSHKSSENYQFPKITAKAHGVLSNQDHQYKKKFESAHNPKVVNKNKNEDKKITEIRKSSFTHKKIR